MKKKIWIVSGAVLLILIILLAGWVKTPTFEGGNIALQYNKGRWHLTYRREACSVFCLESKKDSDFIWIVPIEDDGSIFERFHEDFLVEMFYPFGFMLEEESKKDLREEQGFLYYNDDFVDRRGERESYITFGKKLENIYVIGLVYIDRSEDETEEERLLERRNEALEILSSITYSDWKRVWLIQDKSYHWMIDDWVWTAKQNEGKWEEPDRTRDSVPDEETAKRIAEEHDKECGWSDWRDKDDYEVSAVYLEQSYIWILHYKHKAPEGHMVLDGGGGTVRIRRDNGEVTDDTRRVF